MNMEHQSRSTRSISLVALVRVTPALVVGLVGRQSTGRNMSRCLGLLLSYVSFPLRMCSAWAKSISSLTRRDSMLLMAGFPETSYPWLRVHILRSCSTFTLFSVLDLVFTFCALQPNKVYIGGLPENTRQEDLQSCFGKIGEIANIELKYVSS